MAARWGERLVLGLLAVVLLAVTGATTNATALAGEDDMPGTLDDLFDLFGVDTVAGDFVVVIDTSGSMASGDDPPYPRVVQAFEALVMAIPDGDHLSVITFDDAANLLYNATVDGDPARAEAIAALPDAADGGATDIGLAIEGALDRLERPDASAVQTVIVLTDGAHQPGRGSRYPTVHAPVWGDLRARADGLRRLHELQVLGIAVAPEGEQGTALLRSVFGNPQLNSLSGDQLADFFREAVRRSQLLRLRSLIAEELEHSVRVQSRESARLDDRIEAEVSVVSEFEKLPVTVAIERVSATDSDGRPVRATSVGGQSVVIDPGGSGSLDVLVEPEVDDIGFQFPPVTEEREVQLSVTVSVVAEPKDLLVTVVDLPVRQTVDGSHLIDAERTYGWTLRQIVTRALLGLLLLLVLWMLYRHFIQVPKLVGGFEIVGSTLPPEKSFVRLKGKRMEVGGSQVPGAGTAKIEVFTRRRKRGRIYASVERPPFYELDDRGRERQVMDVAEVKLGSYRLGSARIRYRSRPRERSVTTRTGEETRV